MLGAFALTLSVSISIHNPGFPIPTPAMAGLTLGLLVHLLGPVSGCLLNPAVTIGVWSVGKLEASVAGAFVAAQFAGAGFALVLGRLLFPRALPLLVDGAVIGTALVVAISWAAHRSNGVLNPAVALGIGSLSWPYVWGPVLGALAGARLAKYMWGPGGTVEASGPRSGSRP
ncbi:aquaporin [Candidatus Palauibacter sp.]|uniref:aquaporin n=1 Tax=Candidatus Palauibacter sp. TaxID=3101350 RepID=UPI003C6F91F6